MYTWRSPCFPALLASVICNLAPQVRILAGCLDPRSLKGFMQKVDGQHHGVLFLFESWGGDDGKLGRQSGCCARIGGGDGRKIA